MSQKPSLTNQSQAWHSSCNTRNTDIGRYRSGQFIFFFQIFSKFSRTILDVCDFSKIRPEKRNNQVDHPAWYVLEWQWQIVKRDSVYGGRSHFTVHPLHVPSSLTCWKQECTVLSSRQKNCMKVPLMNISGWQLHLVFGMVLKRKPTFHIGKFLVAPSDLNKLLSWLFLHHQELWGQGVGCWYF